MNGDHLVSDEASEGRAKARVGEARDIGAKDFQVVGFDERFCRVECFDRQTYVRSSKYAHLRGNLTGV